MTRLLSQPLGSLVTLFALLAGCDGPSYPAVEAEPTLVIHGLLVADRAEQEILLERTRFLDEGLYLGLTPVPAARVSVSGAEEHVFTEDPERPGLYRASFIPAPGMRYALRIDGPEGELITGETRVPEAPRLLAPAQDTVMTLSGILTLRWTSAVGAAGYAYMMRALDDPLYPTGVIVQDTVLTKEAGTLVTTFDRVQLELRIAAVDSNYARYFPNGIVPDQRYRLVRTVEGGWGLFGSVAFSDTRILTID